MSEKETTTELIEHHSNLPATIEELIDFVIVGNEAVKAWKNKVRAINKVEVASEAHKQSLHDGQQMGKLVLLAEAKLGELLDKRDKDKAYEGLPSTGGRKPDLPNGVNWKESHYAQEIYRHPNIMHQIIAETIDKNDIPTRHDVLKAIKENKREAKIEVQKEEIKQGLGKPDGLYDIIVIDPPWEYGRKYDSEGGRVSSPYPEMSFEELEKIKLPSKEDCILWCWTTHQFIYDAIELLEKWGFKYKCILVWDKEKMGIGKWLRLQTEFCLLGVKGKPLWEKKDIRDIIREPRTEHSVKPELFYKMIDDNFVGRKLDYFGRKERKGWDIFGAGQNSL